MANVLQGKWKVPGVGEVPKLAAVGGLAVVGVLIWRYRTQQASVPAGPPASAAAGADQYPPDGTTGDPSDPYSTDPDTGQTYGDEQLAGNFGSASGLVTGADSYPWDGTYGNANDPFSMDPGTGVTYGDEGGGGSGGGGTTGSGGPPFSTNAQWSQYALQQLTGTSGLDAGTVTNALGLYLNGQTVTAAQKQVIDDAIAIAGQPPVAAASGFPPSIRTSEPTTGGKTYATNPVTGLRVSKIDRTVATVTWKASPHATSYAIKVTSGKRSVLSKTSSAPTTELHGLKAGTKYQVTVLANPARSSARHASGTFTTKRAASHPVHPGTVTPAPVTQKAS